MNKLFVGGQTNWTLTFALATAGVSACGGAAGGSLSAKSAAPDARHVASADTPTRATDASKPQGAATPSTTPASTPDAAPVAKPELARVVPAACVDGVTPCAAPDKFVDKVCHGKFPSLALSLFAKGTPWRRGYVKVQTLEPVNVYEGERSEEWLSFGEEVLVLRTRGPGGHGGVQVSGPTDVDILRWDGTCATVRQEMLAPWPTNTSILTARVVWKYLDETTQQALLTNKLVEHASDRERPACKGSTMKHPDAACDKASRKLTEVISVAVRDGMALPTPEKLPAWSDERPSE
jgi:hypothetical protein